MKYALLLAFAATIPLANWMIGNVGTVCYPDGPCVIPVGFGLTAPSGVLAIGVALVLRDLVQRAFGVRMALAAIVAGSVLSFILADPYIATASAAAFLLSELADLAVYTPLARKRLAWAVILSGIVGAAVDSSLFLWLAFGSLDLMAGQVIGKLYASALFAAWLLIRVRPTSPSPERG
jgi:uncharacterized PurR-regulated membrane protein YhhQ (DUF165 family)